MAQDDRIERVGSRLLDLPEPAGDLSRFKPTVDLDNGSARPTRHAAVLIALVQRDDDISVLYTERSAALRAHSGQVAFPGGTVDETDRDIAHTALREANEEVAMDASDAQIIGYMPNVFAQSNFLVTPVVAVVRPRAPFVMNPDEVETIFELPLGHIADAASYEPQTLGNEKFKFRTWRIAHTGPTVWGLTAFMTRSFRDRVLHEGEDW